MTLADLHNINDFAGLFTDPRFVALLNYRREHIGRSPHHQQTHAEAMIYNGAHKEGWLDAINSLPELANPPRPDAAPKRDNLYSQRP